jgi:hypothetical protein
MSAKGCSVGAIAIASASDCRQRSVALGMVRILGMLGCLVYLFALSTMGYHAAACLLIILLPLFLFVCIITCFAASQPRSIYIVMITPGLELHHLLTQSIPYTEHSTHRIISFSYSSLLREPPLRDAILRWFSLHLTSYLCYSQQLRNGRRFRHQFQCKR